MPLCREFFLNLIFLEMRHILHLPKCIYKCLNLTEHVNGLR